MSMAKQNSNQPASPIAAPQTRWAAILPILALFLLLIGFYPPVPLPNLLYNLTGEESFPAQMRGAIGWLHTSVRPAPRLAPLTPFPYPPTTSLGVNTFLQQEVLPEVREQSIQHLHAAGFRYIRQEFPWEDIEIHAKNDFEDRRNMEAIGAVNAWTKYDEIVTLTEQYDIEIIARLSNPPAWSRTLTNTVGSQAPPDHIQDYVDFAEAVASRYKGRIRYYQIWNEPNIYPEWGEQQVDPVRYTDLLCQTYTAIKTVDPEAVILSGALAPTIALNWRDLNDLVYLQRMYDHGAANCFDILSAQGYGLWSGATDHRLRPLVINYPHHLFLRDLMVVNNDAQKPIWISEIGWNTVPDGMGEPYGKVTEEEQARYTIEAYERAAAEWPWVGVIHYWFLKRPSDAEQNQPWYYFRLLEPDFTPLPVYTALLNHPDLPTSTPIPNWFYLWNQLRSPFILLGGGYLFYWLLKKLTD